jgi:Tol biopolymer transport system component
VGEARIHSVPGIGCAVSRATGRFRRCVSDRSDGTAVRISRVSAAALERAFAAACDHCASRRGHSRRLGNLARRPSRRVRRPHVWRGQAVDSAVGVGESTRTSGDRRATYPFWSPDGRFVAFFAVGKLKRIAVDSGVTSTICDVGLGRGGTWNEQGTILFNSVNDGPLLSVAATGGSPVPVTMIDQARGENSHRFPYFLPDGRRFLFYVRAPDPNVAGVYLGSLDDPQQKKQLIASPTAAVLASAVERGPAYLAWVDNGSLMARPFDVKTAEMRGEAAAVGGPARFNLPNRYGDVSVSRNGTLVYATGVTPAHRITSFDRSGKALDTIGPPDAYEGIRLSPDGTHIAVSRGATSSHSAGIAILEIARGIATPMVSGFWGSWSHDGQRIAYSTSPSGAPNLYTMSTSGNGERERLTQSPNSQSVIDWSPDEHFILYSEQPNDVAAATESGLWVLPLADRKPFLLVKTAFRQAHGQFSPDGRWIAYTSTESGRAEIWVQSFPAGHAKRQVSSTGGDYPRWREDTRELFYVGADEMLMSVAVQRSADSMEIARPVQLFKVSMRSGTTTVPERDYAYDVARDGQRILAITATGDTEPQTLVVISNVPAEFRNPATTPSPR